MLNSFVSVIIPVFNDSERLNICLQALEAQTYPKSLYEVIVVDNCSPESIEPIVAKFKQAKSSFEASPGSYAARNKGIALAKGEIFAFIDSDCLPKHQWIENGVKALESEAADLVGGKVTFTFSPEKTPSEMYDSISNMQIKKNIETRRVTKTANLFIRKHVFESIGLFPAELQSGGDVLWTKRATDANFKLIYSPDAEVFHPARKLLLLLKKQYRVGRGQTSIWLEQGQTLKQVIIKTLFDFRPPSLRKFWIFICQNGTDEMRSRFVSMWLVAWICISTTSLGRLNSIFKEVSSSK